MSSLSDESMDVTGNGIIFYREDKVREVVRLLKEESYKLTGGKETWFSTEFDKKIDKIFGEDLK